MSAGQEKDKRKTRERQEKGKRKSKERENQKKEKIKRKRKSKERPWRCHLQTTTRVSPSTYKGKLRFPCEIKLV